MENPLAELEAWWVGRGQDEYEFGTAVTRYTEEGETIRIEFATVGGQDTAYPERSEWLLTVEGIEEAVRRWENDEPEWFDSHVLLTPYLDRRAWISLSRPLKDPLRAWGAVAKAHHDVCGDWLSPDRFFRASMIDAPFGILAEGAEPVVSAYAEALRTTGEDIGLGTTDRAWPVADPRPSVVTWGASYFVARSFRLERL